MNHRIERTSKLSSRPFQPVQPSPSNDVKRLKVIDPKPILVHVIDSSDEN